jgi:hypothetical protein
MERTFTLDQIKRAFWDNFHESGEFWFSYLGSKSENQALTTEQWNMFSDKLMQQNH